MSALRPSWVLASPACYAHLRLSYSLLQPYNTRALRSLLRHNSTSAPESSQTSPPPPPPPPHPPSRQPYVRSFVPFATAFVFIAVGYLAGESVRSFIRPLWYPEPGTPEDQVILEKIGHDIDELSVVTSMRSKVHSGDTTGGAWRELLTDHIAETESLEGTLPSNPLTPRTVSATRTLTLSTLRASGLLGPQRVFYNSHTRSLVAVMWFGSNLSGWPNVTHGGAIATVLDEACARTVVGPDHGLDELEACKSVELTYRKPTVANMYYVLTADVAGAIGSQDEPDDSGLEHKGEKSTTGWFRSLAKAQYKPGTKKDVVVNVTLETLGGVVCARAKAIWDGGEAEKFIKR